MNKHSLEKPLGRKAYGSIGHLPNSRLGPKDHCVTEGQARICTKKSRDKHDKIIVQEKLDGSCTAVTLINGEIIALGRAGYRAFTSPYEQHKMFALWVKKNESRFRKCLKEGERLIGEWLAQAHGTLYDISNDYEPWAVFDLMIEIKRFTVEELKERVDSVFLMPNQIHEGQPITVEQAMQIHESKKWPCDITEGVVYRVERKEKVDFLAKWVRPTKVDGKYLPEISGKEAIWNWRFNEQLDS